MNAHRPTRAAPRDNRRLARPAAIATITRERILPQSAANLQPKTRSCWTTMNYPYRKKKPIRSSTPVARPAKGLDTRDIRDIDRTGRAADRPAATATESDSPSYPAPRARANPPETAMATTREQSEAVSPGGSSCGRSPNGIAPLRTSRRRSFKSAGSPTSSDCRRAV